MPKGKCIGAPTYKNRYALPPQNEWPPRYPVAFPEARVIIVTNYDNEALRQAAREAGARGYVLKDNLFEMRSLLQAVTD
jgi:CheY-like chemotaxis protein